MGPVPATSAPLSVDAVLEQYAQVDVRGIRRTPIPVPLRPLHNTDAVAGWLQQNYPRVQALDTWIVSVYSTRFVWQVETDGKPADAIVVARTAAGWRCWTVTISQGKDLPGGLVWVRQSGKRNTPAVLTSFVPADQLAECLVRESYAGRSWDHQRQTPRYTTAYALLVHLGVIEADGNYREFDDAVIATLAHLTAAPATAQLPAFDPTLPVLRDVWNRPCYPVPAATVPTRATDAINGWLESCGVTEPHDTWYARIPHEQTSNRVSAPRYGVITSSRYGTHALVFTTTALPAHHIAFEHQQGNPVTGSDPAQLHRQLCEQIDDTPDPHPQTCLPSTLAALLIHARHQGDPDKVAAERLLLALDDTGVHRRIGHALDRWRTEPEP